MIQTINFRGSFYQLHFSIYDRGVHLFFFTGVTLNILRYSTLSFIEFIIHLNFQQTVVFDLFKRLLGSGPVYAALGNHDSYNQSVTACSFGAHDLHLYLRAQDVPHAIGGALANQFSW